MAGIMITDYFLLRHTYLDVGELYNPRGIYRYGSGVNYRAIVALAAGVVVALIGLLVPPLRWLYDYAWFVGFLVASVTYWISMRKLTSGGTHVSSESLKPASIRTSPSPC
jgi:NCS1 family nucleobase:cation symporter-1